MISNLSYKQLYRKGESSNGITREECLSVDFLVNENSLLKVLSDATAGHNDFMGCFVQGYPEQNTDIARKFLAIDDPDTENGRVLLYVCPECGDIGCGSYAARIEKTEDIYIWKDFAYENGYEKALPINGVGPFSFDACKYEHLIKAIIVEISLSK